MPGVSRQTLDTILSQVTAGRLDEAELACRREIESSPDDVNVLGLLGAILINKREFDEAEELLLKTVALEPAFAKPHEDLGRLYLLRNSADKALPMFEHAVSLDQSQPSALAGLAEALRRLGRTDEAARAHQQFVALSPTARALDEAQSLHRDGNAAHAEKICQDILRREPENIAALRMLAIIASEDERFVVAEGLLRRIVKIAPENAAALRDLGRFLGERSRYAEASGLLEQATTLDPQDADAWLALADVMSVLGRSADALVAYEKCLDKNPSHPTALIGRGHMLRIAGRRDDAVGSYRKATALRVATGDAWWSLAAMHGFEATDDDLAAMQGALQSDNVTVDTAIPLHFAIARALEARGDYGEAWQHYAAGNQQKRTLVKYDPVETEVLHNKLKEVFSAALMQEKQGTPAGDVTPIFIVGLPRSGSTLVEQILASHSGVEGCGELPYVVMLTSALGGNRAETLRYPEIVREFDASQLEGLGRSYLHHAETHRREKTKYFTDKMPANFSHAGIIRMMLPQAKIIDARRHPLATCVANYRQLFAQGKNQSYDLTELGEYYLLYESIMRHWGEVMPGSVLRVDYEAVVGSLEAEVRRILEFCDLPFEPSCVEFHESRRPVNTASAEQVRQPIYDSAVEFWRHYDQHLGELKTILAPLL